MSTGIKPKRQLDTKSFGEYARRYVFYPLKNLTFYETQPTSPIYCPTFPKSEIVLLEAVPYIVTGVGDGLTGSAGVQETKIMGTDAQVNFLMGHNESGYMASGMTYLEHLTAADPEMVIEIQEFIFPEGYKPKTLVELNDHLLKRLLEVEGDLRAEIELTIHKMLEGTKVAMDYCQRTINEIENEINDSKTGKKMAMKSGLDANDLYLYKQVGRALPEDKSGVNMAQELGKILAGAIGAPQLDPNKELEERMMKQELEALKRELDQKDKLIQELAGYEAESAE